MKKELVEIKAKIYKHQMDYLLSIQRDIRKARHSHKISIDKILRDILDKYQFVFFPKLQTEPKSNRRNIRELNNYCHSCGYSWTYKTENFSSNIYCPKCNSKKVYSAPKGIL